MNLHFFWPERHVPKEFIAKFLWGFN
jgi:hypothetical protein